ncbi:hypothetical protein GCM10027566_37740 [Arachidicoccus ginsenosidivorans]|uniref:Uncharacterized protein n=1 Tax=Arachidicoccus ginsenosidivorans TaxID=496057 RepID=A0A5B8VL94_9BACT|nr:hypothetical protein [Arachidicoccus ginsenosidivorans]QEC72297.1 hypothetical protein FSB73_12050 [Arachidicoccus ginsenosidivorans]
MIKNKFTLAIVAFMLLIGAGVYAMHTSRHSQFLNAKTWDYNGVAGEEANPAKYTVGDANNPAHATCGLFQTTICQITAEPNPSDTTKPNLGGLDPMAHKIEFSATLRADE